MYYIPEKVLDALCCNGGMPRSGPITVTVNEKNGLVHMLFFTAVNSASWCTDIGFASYNRYAPQKTLPLELRLKSMSYNISS